MLASSLRRLLDFYQRRKRLVRIVGAILGLIVLLTGWKVNDQIQNNPKFCTSCHLMTGPFSKWETSPHREVNCHTCHPGSLQENLHQLWATVTEQPREIKKHASIDPKVCAKCHLSSDRRWKQVAATAGHRVHVERHKITCVRCHSPSVHVFQPMIGVCQSCHQEITIRVGGMEHFDCLNCHDYTARQPVLLPTSAACLSCHRTPGGKGIHDGGPGARRPASPTEPPVGVHANIPCGECHLPHGQVTRLEGSTNSSQPRRRVTAARTVRECRDCHSNAWAQTQASKTAGHQECASCHGGHTDRAKAKGTCDGCHADKQAHKGKHVSCSDCHTPHEWRQVKAERCQGCHQAQVSRVASARGAHTDCVSCHGTARAAAAPGAAARPVARAAIGATPALTKAASLSCARCHAKAATTIARGVKMHRDCQSCHPKHEEQQVTAAVCTRCHARQVQATAAARVPQHQKCEKCHGAHPGPRTAAQAACATCHTGPGQLVARAKGEHRACGSCHEAHDPARGAAVAGKKTAAAACANCHDDKAKGLQAARGPHADCASCHAKHGPPRAGAAASCAGCHKQGKAAGPLIARHGGCARCHDVHSATPRKVDCRTCHGGQARKVTGAPEDHRTCGNCHEAHGAGKAAGQCVNCHDGQVKALKARKNENHADCSSCHDAHAPKGDPSKACAGCHEDKAAALSSRGPHGSCKSCHQPHGKSAAARPCGQCHTPAKLGGLHRTKAHERCAACHGQHQVKPDLTRAKCESCHADKKGHNPGGPCASCHLFR
jgi:nitrate/TMAO reductase-like tetraheme cytochrome c subunit